MAAFPMINGVAHSWSNVTIKIEGVEFDGVKDISYSDSVNRSKIRGTGAKIIGITSGEYDVDSASLSMYMPDFVKLQNGLAVLSPAGWMNATFTVMVGYEVFLPVPSLVYDMLYGCKIKKVSNDHSQGPDALLVKIELDVTEIFRNGKPALIDI